MMVDTQTMLCHALCDSQLKRTHSLVSVPYLSPRSFIWGLLELAWLLFHSCSMWLSQYAKENISLLLSCFIILAERNLLCLPVRFFCCVLPVRPSDWCEWKDDIYGETVTCSFFSGWIRIINSCHHFGLADIPTLYSWLSIIESTSVITLPPVAWPLNLWQYLSNLSLYSLLQLATLPPEPTCCIPHWWWTLRRALMMLLSWAEMWCVLTA